MALDSQAPPDRISDQEREARNAERAYWNEDSLSV